MVLSLPVSQRRGIHQCRAGFFQRDCARMQGRAGGEDIVDDDIAGVWVDGLPVGDDKGAGDILPALLPAEAGLGDGLMLFTQEELSPASGDMFRQDSGDAFRLIVAAIKFPG